MSAVPHTNPLCYAVYEKDRLCAACYKNRSGLYECTALTETYEYMDNCPFFAPMCDHRVNDRNGFRICLLKGKKTDEGGRTICDGLECKAFMEVRQCSDR